MHLDFVKTDIEKSDNIINIKNDNINFSFLIKPMLSESHILATINDIFSKNVYYSYYLDKLKDIVVIDTRMKRSFSTLYFASLANVKKVYGYEPSKTLFDFATQNIALNKAYAEKIITNNYGLSPASSNTEMEVTYNMVDDRDSIFLPHNDKYLLPEDYNITEKYLYKSFSEEIHNIIQSNMDSDLILKIDCDSVTGQVLQSGNLIKTANIKYITGEYYGDFAETYGIMSSSGFVVITINTLNGGFFFAYRG